LGEVMVIWLLVKIFPGRRKRVMDVV
jgi:hypothetical protein